MANGKVDKTFAVEVSNTRMLLWKPKGGKQKNSLRKVFNYKHIIP